MRDGACYQDLAPGIPARLEIAWCCGLAASAAIAAWLWLYAPGAAVIATFALAWAAWRRRRNVRTTRGLNILGASDADTWLASLDGERTMTLNPEKFFVLPWVILVTFTGPVPDKRRLTMFLTPGSAGRAVFRRLSVVLRHGISRRKGES